MNSSNDLRAEKKSTSPLASLFWWSLIFSSLTALGILSWTSSIYTFSNPQEKISYKILTKLDRLPPIQKFSKSSPPQSKVGYRSPRELIDSEFSNLSGVHLIYQNDILLKNYIQNYKEENSIYYIKGDFIITKVRELDNSDTITDGLAIKANSKNFNKADVIILLPFENFNMKNELLGSEVSLKSNHFSSVVNVSVNKENKTTFTIIPIVYGKFEINDNLSLNLTPPKKLNIEGQWPIVFKN